MSEAALEGERRCPACRNWHAGRSPSGLCHTCLTMKGWRRGGSEAFRARNAGVRAVGYDGPEPEMITGMVAPLPEEGEMHTAKKHLHWYTVLDTLTENAAPQCPLACVFRLLCPDHVQEGVSKLFEQRYYQRPRDCLWYAKLVERIRQEFGQEQVFPHTPHELLDMIRTLRAAATELELDDE